MKFDSECVSVSPHPHIHMRARLNVNTKEVNLLHGTSPCVYWIKSDMIFLMIFLSMSTHDRGPPSILQCRHMLLYRCHHPVCSGRGISGGGNTGG